MFPPPFFSTPPLPSAFSTPFFLFFYSIDFFFSFVGAFSPISLVCSPVSSLCLSVSLACCGSCSSVLPVLLDQSVNAEMAQGDGLVSESKNRASGHYPLRRLISAEIDVIV